LKNERQSKGKPFEFPREIPVNAVRLPSGGRNFAIQIFTGRKAGWMLDRQTPTCECSK
jgi:hypothetical protein